MLISWKVPKTRRPSTTPTTETYYVFREKRLRNMAEDISSRPQTAIFPWIPTSKSKALLTISSKN